MQSRLLRQFSTGRQYPLKEIVRIEHDSQLVQHTKELLNYPGIDSQAIFVQSLPVSPYTVYGVTFGGNRSCGNVMSVDHEGSLSRIIQSFDYQIGSGVHGLTIGPNHDVLYSADDSGNSLWAHSINSDTGQVEFLDRIAAPNYGSDPRHITVHPKGKFAYVVFEGTNKLVLYRIDPKDKTLASAKSFPLIPPGYPNSEYWSDEVRLSYSNSYIWATSRSHRSSYPGYISAFSISETGDILSQLFLTPTTTSGGMANAVAPSTSSDEFVAITDSEKGLIQIWRFTGRRTEVVATLDLRDGGCCANAFWYD
ncbi:uncharacterized protein N7479_003983 [Penicillium vulpinum]|uniref:uncharacterized protein n=1 Tax=Penicillium vulpinum TaxID=29845 RepID=UPI00254761EB|nr:uncharacterized protein N7479_003983 [Penicillium vulpinum]KAJ5964107.1 hypothetical protein N7479_003983 [Penicillium vulpinum]